MVSARAETGEEVLLRTNENLARRKHYNPGCARIALHRLVQMRLVPRATEGVHFGKVIVWYQLHVVMLRSPCFAAIHQHWSPPITAASDFFGMRFRPFVFSAATANQPRRFPFFRIHFTMITY